MGNLEAQLRLRQPGMPKNESRKNRNFNLMVEIRSLNSKYFDIIPKIDDTFNIYQNEIIQLIKDKCERGKIYLNIEITKTYNQTNKIKLDDSRVNTYLHQAKLLNKKMKTNQEISLTSMLKMPGVFIEEDLMKKIVKKFFSVLLIKHFLIY